MEGGKGWGGRTGVQVAVKVDDGDGPVGALDGPQQGQGDGVVAAEGDDAGERLALDGGAALVGVGRGRAREDAVVAILDLLERPGVVVPWGLLVGEAGNGGLNWTGLRGHRDVTAVEHGGPAVEGVRLERDVVATTDSSLVLKGVHERHGGHTKDSDGENPAGCPRGRNGRPGGTTCRCRKGRLMAKISGVS